MSFNDMALEKLAKSAPELTRYVVAFNDMSGELSDSSSVNVGVFVLKRGGTQFFVPVIAKSGTVFPIDSVYLGDKKTFFPLTQKTVEQIRSGGSFIIGEPSRIPAAAVRNPDLKDLIVPPRTGKFIYAGSSRVGEMMATLSPAMKAELAAILENDNSVANALDKVLNVSDLLQCLKSPTKMIEEVVEAEFPSVLTDGTGLDHDAVQDILRSGYHVKGAHKFSRVAVESFGGESFTKLSSAEIGRGYVFIAKNGEDLHGVVLSRNNNNDYLVAFEGGHVVTVPSNAVIRQQEVDARKIMHDLNTVSVLDMGVLKTDNWDVVINDGKTWTLYDIFRASETDTSVEYTVRSGGISRIIVSTGMHGNSEVVGDTLFLSATCRAAKMYEGDGKTFQIETDLGAAIKRDSYKKLALLPEFHVVRFHNGFFSYDGHHVGRKPEMAKHLIEKEQLQKEAAERFMEMAESKSRVELYMSKSAGVRDTKPTEMVEYGEKLPPDHPGTGTAMDRARGSLRSGASVANQVRDQQVVEATIMSELLADTETLGTISDYLPDIMSAVDKLGRILFLSRVNSDKLSEQMDPEALSNLITTIRNSYRNLGENYIKLENLTQNV